MEYQGLRIASDILFKVFWIGFIFLIVSWLLLTLLRVQWEGAIMSLWQLRELAFLEMLTLSFYAMAKFVLFFYVLIPAIAIRCTVNKLEKGKLS